MTIARAAAAAGAAADLEQVVRAAEKGALRMPIAGIVPLGEAIPALTDFELRSGPRRGKLIITT
ncbi:hypothetical protein [Micromonospora avicenniae]|uniref:hypothetical protein n=1 Tax=Micromonospora avicenniae TaxID=1198245 RepID=UPI00332E7220